MRSLPRRTSVLFGEEQLFNVSSPRLVSIEEALAYIDNSMRVVTAMAAAEPQAFFSRIGDRCRDLRNVTVHCSNPSRDYACFVDDCLAGRLELRVMFLTDKVRHCQGHKRVHYVPQHLSSWVRNLLREHPVDVFWGSCTPPDSRGFVSLGPGACYEPEILRVAKTVILEVNPNLPVTAGATTIPTSWVTAFVASDKSLPALERRPPDAIDRLIAAHIADLVADGSTIQLGIGGIPNALGEALATKRDLGVHTEMINDTLMDLYLRGVISGRKKTLWPGKMVGAFIFGSAELYRFADANPAIELQPASVVNDPYRIGRNHRMVSINSAIEVDLTGQVCSESIGHIELSGVGGAAETHIGAQRSDGGRGIVALHSTTKDGRSKIAWELTPGAKVSISRNDIDTIVTEHGVAMLAGKSVAERVRALAAIAAPQFRDLLLEKADRAGYL